MSRPARLHFGVFVLQLLCCLTRAASHQPMPPEAVAVAGAWRGSPDTGIGRVVSSIHTRARQHETEALGGLTVEEVLASAMLDNRAITNDQLFAISRLTIQKLTDPDEMIRETLRRVPNARQLDSHRFTIALLASLTGLDAAQLSQGAPALGLTGSPRTVLLFAPEQLALARSTALHDTTDYLRAAGIGDVNRAVWGAEDPVLSALLSVFSQ